MCHWSGYCTHNSYVGSLFCILGRLSILGFWKWSMLAQTNASLWSCIFLLGVITLSRGASNFSVAFDAKFFLSRVFFRLLLYLTLGWGFLGTNLMFGDRNQLLCQCILIKLCLRLLPPSNNYCNSALIWLFHDNF